MPVDGSYGRLNAHNERFKELRRKKIKRREDKIKRNNNSTSPRGGKIEFESTDPEKLELIKTEIRKKAKTQQRKEILLIAISIIVTLGIVYFFYLKLTD